MRIFFKILIVVSMVVVGTVFLSSCSSEYELVYREYPSLVYTYPYGYDYIGNIHYWNRPHYIHRHHPHHHSTIPPKPENHYSGQQHHPKPGAPAPQATVRPRPNTAPSGPMSGNRGSSGSQRPRVGGAGTRR